MKKSLITLSIILILSNCSPIKSIGSEIISVSYQLPTLTRAPLNINTPTNTLPMMPTNTSLLGASTPTPCYDPSQEIPTLWKSHLNPCDSWNSTNTQLISPTAPEMANKIDPLTGGLFIEEYKVAISVEKRKEFDNWGHEYAHFDLTSLVEDPWQFIPDIYSRHPTIGGWYFWPKGGELDGQLFSATVKSLENEDFIIGTLGGKEIYRGKCGPGLSRPLITAWTYQKDWIIQSDCNENLEVIWNGERINTKNSYQASYGLQLLDKKPFYFFTRNNEVWVHYADSESKLPYDGIFADYDCCDEGPTPPQHYERAISFSAYKGSQYFYVFIGKE